VDISDNTLAAVDFFGNVYYHLFLILLCDVNVNRYD